MPKTGIALKRGKSVKFFATKKIVLWNIMKNVNLQKENVHQYFPDFDKIPTRLNLFINLYKKIYVLGLQH